jgi:hypothetical protein
MDKKALMREVEKLEPSQRETYEAVKVYAKTLADALAFAKGTIRIESGTSIMTLTHLMQNPQLQAQVDHLPPKQREVFEDLFFYRRDGKLVSFDEAMAIAKAVITPAMADAMTESDIPDAEQVREGYHDRLTNAWKGAD